MAKSEIDALTSSSFNAKTGQPSSAPPMQQCSLCGEILFNMPESAVDTTKDGLFAKAYGQHLSCASAPGNETREYMMFQKEWGQLEKTRDRIKAQNNPGAVAGSQAERTQLARDRALDIRTLMDKYLLTKEQAKARLDGKDVPPIKVAEMVPVEEAAPVEETTPTEENKEPTE